MTKTNYDQLEELKRKLKRPLSTRLLLLVIAYEINYDTIQKQKKNKNKKIKVHPLNSEKVFN